MGRSRGLRRIILGQALSLVKFCELPLCCLLRPLRSLREFSVQLLSQLALIVQIALARTNDPIHESDNTNPPTTRIRLKIATFAEHTLHF